MSHNSPEQNDSVVSAVLAERHRCAEITRLYTERMAAHLMRQLANVSSAYARELGATIEHDIRAGEIPPASESIAKLVAVAHEIRSQRARIAEAEEHMKTHLLEDWEACELCDSCGDLVLKNWKLCQESAGMFADFVLRICKVSGPESAPLEAVACGRDIL